MTQVTLPILNSVFASGESDLCVWPLAFQPLERRYPGKALAGA